MIQIYQTIKPSLMITTSSTEGSPVSLQEAFSMGIPCIGTAVGGIPELIEDGKTGYLLSSNPDPGEIARVIERFYFADKETKEKMRKNAYAEWTRKYNATENARILCEKLIELVEE